MDGSLKVEKIQIERKQFYFDLQENTRGRYLRITEDVGGRRDTIIIPVSGLAEFRKILDHMLSVENKLSSATTATPPPATTPPA